MKKSRSSYDLAVASDLRLKNPMKYQSSADLVETKNVATGNDGKHKVVIYFSDAYNNICNKTTTNDIDQTNRNANSSNKDFMAQLKTVLEEKSKFTNKFIDGNNSSNEPTKISLQNKFLTKPAVPEKPNMNMRVNINQQQPQPSSSSTKCNGQQQQRQQQQINEKSSKQLLPSFIESIDENNVIKLKIEQNFRKASELVNLISSMPKRRARKCDTSNETSSIHELNFSHEEEIDDVDQMDSDEDDDAVSEADEGYFYDWSFVQEWRSRPLKASNGVKAPIPIQSSSAATSNKQKQLPDQIAGKSNRTKLAKTVNAAGNGHSSHIIHAEAAATQNNNNRNILSSESLRKQTKMQNQQPVTTIAPKMAKEISLRPLGAPDNGLPTSPINMNVKSPVHHFGSPPPRIHCSSSASMMIPERDIGPPARLLASPPTLTQATPPNATIVQPNYRPIPQRAVMGPTRHGVTVQSTPVKAQPALISSSLAGKVFVPTTVSCNGKSSNNNVIQNSPQRQQQQSTTSIDVVDNEPKHFHAQNPTNLPAPQPLPAQKFSSHNGPINQHPPVPHQFHAQQQPQMSNVSQQQHMQQQNHQTVNGTALQPNPMKPKTSINMNITRSHNHADFNTYKVQQHDCHSSSDENRSSGHASMSDTGGHGSSSPRSNKTGQLGSVPEDSRLAAGVTSRNGRSRASTGKPRHRAVSAKNPWSGSGLEDIKTAIQQLTLRSQTSTSTYSSLSAGSESSEPARRLGRYSSLETVNTNVTTADEFVWVDSHNRLVELQHPPWSQYCLMRVIRTGRCKDFSERISAEAVPRLGYLLTRALVRISREIQRLSSILGLCSKHEVAGAFKMVLCPALADSCIKACLRAAAMFALSGDGMFKQTKSSRAGLQLPVGRFHRWMIDARLGKLVHEYAAVYLCAGFENLLEEILLQCMPSDATVTLTAMGLEHAIANSGDLWGLLQPFVHLNAGRIASGALTMPRWTSESSVGSNHNNSVPNSMNHGGNIHINNNGSNKQEPCLLTTCVGSLSELKDLVNRSQKRSNHITMSQAALRELFYFMRCSQLEHNEANNNNNSNSNNNVNSHNNGNNNGNNNIQATTTTASAQAQTSSTNASNGANAITNNGNSNIQELCYERAYIVLPPLIEWLRVASAHAEYRHSTLIDRNDIIQAARLLLPGVDCPPRQLLCYEELPSAKHYTIPSNIAYNQGSISSNSSGSNACDDYVESGRRATIELAFRLMLSGIPELLVQAMSLVSPTTRYDTYNHQGLTPLMVAAILNDETAIQMLLDSGANPNVEVPSIGHSSCPAIHPETQNWTALTFAACRGNYQALRVLLERGAKVEGGARFSEEKCTFTPLQVASGSGCIENVSMLLAHGASSFLSTKQSSMAFSGRAQQGCFSAISVATAHGQRLTLRKLLSHPFVAEKQRDVLSLEEMLAEGDSNARSSHERQNEVPPSLSKAQIRALQEAMYHSAENNYLDITIELRALGVPWTLHCWMHALAAAHELRLDTVIDQLLQDFLQVCPDDYSQQFVTECLPLLFSIFRYSKKEGTTLLLADIFSTCFGWEPIKPIKENVLQPVNGSRIDPKFVNNRELSDVTFRVEGKIFYGHKIVLVTASPRLQSLLSSKVSEGNGTPTVQINDIRYHIFELVMQYLYSGGTHNLELTGNDADVLELMAAASFFQLEGLLRYTEARCAEIIDIDNVVAMYIHAKVYNASKLMEYCQGFLLQNMVALLTYDDSVKRLLFAKKIPNHDVLSGLLSTLQKRIETRRSSQTTNLVASTNGVTSSPLGKAIKPTSVQINGKSNHHNNIMITNNMNNNSSSSGGGLNKSNHNLTE
ncbi:hypothetical protein PVAND_002302 [Polypedilum vanderplanki]|uniref:BTB domain-containing protein n=1 Tax=Polypedilum vanderplanki TaxID=319348 RepID=A0A9J6BR65_POLVA|nr:hypothetical protein PVAND_002302 [Polypedilum vanderplanki]